MYTAVLDHLIVLRYNSVLQNQWTVLHIASQYGHSSMIETLIKSEADIDVNAVTLVSCFVL